MRPSAANRPYRLPPPLFDARCRACWLVAGILALVVASFLSLDLHLAEFFSGAALAGMGRFLAEFVPPDLSPTFVRNVAVAAWETLAMSLLGTLLAAAGGVLLALPASRQPSGSALQPLADSVRAPARLLLNALRAVPELVWAALLLIAVGLGPFAGTLALAVHTSGVLGRLFAEAIENAPPGPAAALQVQGAGTVRQFLYARMPQVLPQLMSYSLYRWENNIRAAAVLGVVGAGGLGQMLSFHMGLFQMQKTATVLIAMLLLVVLVDGASFAARRWLTR
jgi:phosphonate transport system permease protein